MARPSYLITTTKSRYEDLKEAKVKAIWKHVLGSSSQRPWCGCKCLLPKATIHRFEFKIQYYQMGRKLHGRSFYKVDL
ncbi:hypothetical protein CMV_000997 [Castanea mollissima]|uniref:Uncharacterized protein n=1 Tax=Castanea mollissima TaxID=60419 RepID=A0A8J4RLN5_9ROSI|nr:hypothetical protein CMV_000997 [Castanea mollissima]